MIKLSKNQTPLCLNPTFVSNATLDFKTSGTNVWNILELKKTLLVLSYGKCAYCECNLTTESKYLEVEHFEDKDTNSDKVLDWENLLPSCKRCNVSKGRHDVNLEPIINPFLTDPKEHLKIRLYRFKHKTSIGQSTIQVVDLNNYNRIVKKRFEIGEKFQNLIDDAKEKLEIFKLNKSTRSKNRLLGQLESALNECLPSSEYSATTASILHSSDLYHALKTEMEIMGLWGDDFQILHDLSCRIAMECA